MFWPFSDQLTSVCDQLTSVCDQLTSVCDQLTSVCDQLTSVCDIEGQPEEEGVADQLVEEESHRVLHHTLYQASNRAQ